MSESKKEKFGLHKKRKKTDSAEAIEGKNYICLSERKSKAKAAEEESKWKSKEIFVCWEKREEKSSS